ncbi:MarR family winged helix-turn-helix transcriptional regulator [Isoptericola sp. NPDC019482]|uniref:MarR family winged helix-turn-helix transcriptional regulator n=1 Tax=Isoptericola sp. NPDC019482 TaxID=3154688 RepID=UPI003473A7ED
MNRIHRLGPFSAHGENIGLLLAISSGRAVAAARESLAPYSLSARSYSLLEQLVLTGAPTQRQLADALALDPSQIVALVDSLEDRGLAERRPHPDDRRQKTVVATVAGETVYMEAKEQIKASLDTLLTGLDPDERVVLADLLHRIARPASGALEDAG